MQVHTDMQVDPEAGFIYASESHFIQKDGQVYRKEGQVSKRRTSLPKRQDIKKTNS